MTTAGAIFSTTSAMKLNLYRGLVIGGDLYWQEEPGALVRPRPPGTGLKPKGGGRPGFPTLYRQGRREAPRRSGHLR